MGTNPQYGTDTLEVISAADNFNRWMYRTIARHCRGNILEIGSGIGNISRFFIEDGANIALSDFDKSYLPVLKNKFGKHKHLKGIHHFDFSEQDIEEKHPELVGKFDTVFALNVVEHIENDALTIQNASKLLKDGGRVVILVPAFQRLFNQFDEQLDHKRRYTRASLKQLIESNGFKVQHSQYFNFIGMLGWVFSGSILRKSQIPEGQMKFYDLMVPLWKVIDFFTRPFAGISVIQVGVKDDSRPTEKG